MTKPLIEVESIIKEFSGVRVLDNINFSLEPGMILGLIGENGAGKSTLMKILSGIYQTTGGKIFIEGEEIRLPSPLIAKRHGIAMIPQEFNLIETLSVFENIFLGNEKCKSFLLNKKEMRKHTTKILNMLHTDLNPNLSVRNLSVAQKQMIEIAKALVHNSKLLILDEPTTVLVGEELELLFKLMRELRDQGVCMIFISHKLGEIKEICDKILVLRDGEQIHFGNVGEQDEHDMVKMMVGRDLNQIFPKINKPHDEVILKISNLNLPDTLEDISFEVKKGEILGIAGLMGAGRTELAETIMGLRHKSSGKVSLHNKELSGKNPREAVNAGLAYLSEDRQGKGIIMNFDLPENTTLISIDKYTKLFINKKEEEKRAHFYQNLFQIKAASLKTHLRFLSGGNQQKVYLGKWMDTNPEILILDEPTRGIDVNAKMEIYKFINNLARKGLPCIVISSELEELLGLCHRILVMREGKIQGELDDTQKNEEEVMLYATGLKKG